MPMTFGAHLLVHCLDSVENTLALVDGLVAIAALPSLSLASGSTGRNQTQALSTVFGIKHDLNGRVATGIKNLTRVHAFNCSHNYSFKTLGCDVIAKNNGIDGRSTAPEDGVLATRLGRPCQVIEQLVHP